jgi:hypothetical protein
MDEKLHCNAPQEKQEGFTDLNLTVESRQASPGTLLSAPQAIVSVPGETSPSEVGPGAGFSIFIDMPFCLRPAPFLFLHAYFSAPIRGSVFAVGRVGHGEASSPTPPTPLPSKRWFS